MNTHTHSTLVSSGPVDTSAGDLPRSRANSPDGDAQAPVGGFYSLDDAPICVASQATQRPHPLDELRRMWALVGPRKKPVVEAFQCNSPWVRFANMVELRRLAKLQSRIDRQRAILKDNTDERKLIMNRCIRRMGRVQ